MPSLSETADAILKDKNRQTAGRPGRQILGEASDPYASIFFEEVVVQRVSDNRTRNLHLAFRRHHRQNFARELVKNHRNGLLRLGLTDAQIENLRHNIPDPDYNVHHIVPIDLSGKMPLPNVFTNFCYMQRRAERKVHDFYDLQTEGMKEGEERRILVVRFCSNVCVLTAEEMEKLLPWDEARRRTDALLHPKAFPEPGMPDGFSLVEKNAKDRLRAGLSLDVNNRKSRKPKVTRYLPGTRIK